MKKGSTRNVAIIGRHTVIKFPRLLSVDSFLRGWLANRQELKFSKELTVNEPPYWILYSFRRPSYFVTLPKYRLLSAFTLGIVVFMPRVSETAVGEADRYSANEIAVALKTRGWPIEESKKEYGICIETDRVKFYDYGS